MSTLEPVKVVQKLATAHNSLLGTEALAAEFDVSPATLYRFLNELSKQGTVYKTSMESDVGWQLPNSPERIETEQLKASTRQSPNFTIDI